MIAPARNCSQFPAAMQCILSHKLCCYSIQSPSSTGSRSTAPAYQATSGARVVPGASIYIFSIQSEQSASINMLYCPGAPFPRGGRLAWHGIINPSALLLSSLSCPCITIRRRQQRAPLSVNRIGLTPFWLSHSWVGRGRRQFRGSLSCCWETTWFRVLFSPPPPRVVLSFRRKCIYPP